MDFRTFDLAACSALLAALAYTALVLWLLGYGDLKRSTGRPSLLFHAALISSAAWGWSGVARAATGAPSTIADPLWDLARYACWFAFLLCLLAPAGAERRPRGLLLLVPIATLLIATGLASRGAGPFPGNADSLVERLGLLETLALPVFGLILVEQLFRNLAEDSRWNAKPLCLGLGLVFIFDLYVYSQTTLFGRLDLDAVSIRGSIHALAVPLLFVASRRRSDWVRRLRLSRSAAFHSAALVLAGVYLMLVAGIGYYIRYFGGEWGSALRLATLFVALAGLAVLAVSGAMRSRLRVLLAKHFFSYRYDYREEWLRFTAMLSACSSPAEMGALVIRGLANMVESPAGMLWLREAGQADFSPVARWNAPALTEREAADSAFARSLLDKACIVDLSHCRSDRSNDAELPLPCWLTATTRFWLLIPLIVTDELLGFVVLDQARTAVDVNWEVTDLLKTASRQAAGFLAQMRATEALLEARKFDAFNRMSAFVVHDLKNIVAQLGLMLKNAKRLQDNPEFQQDMLTTVENSLDKMRRLMLQLREGEAPRGGQSGVDLAPIVQRMQAVAAARGRAVDIQVIEPVISRGHEERIERVLGHIVQNALDATEPGDRVWVKLIRRSGQAQVEIGDSGAGMTQEYIQNRLFKPFQTTKRTGMGIGAYESFQYVRELGGSIAADSEVGRGTVMTITLPLFESRPVSDLQMSSVA